jgi:hypothetical protein
MWKRRAAEFALITSNGWEAFTITKHRLGTMFIVVRLLAD